MSSNNFDFRFALAFKKCGPINMRNTPIPTLSCNEPTKYIAYYRVSTQRQGISGLGLEGQKSIVLEFITQTNGILLEEYVEVESGRKTNRVKLAEALKLAKKQKAVLIIAKLDRLARNVHFITGLMASGVDFLACDMPSANKLTIGILACVAEDEADRISQRTKIALKMAKERGVKLGVYGKELARQQKEKAMHHAKSIYGYIEGVRGRGIQSYAKIAAELNAMGIQSYTNGDWHGTSVMRVIKRIESLKSAT